LSNRGGGSSTRNNVKEEKDDPIIQRGTSWKSRGKKEKLTHNRERLREGEDGTREKARKGDKDHFWIRILPSFRISGTGGLGGKRDRLEKGKKGLLEGLPLSSPKV